MYDSPKSYQTISIGEEDSEEEVYDEEIDEIQQQLDSLQRQQLSLAQRQNQVFGTPGRSDESGGSRLHLTTERVVWETVGNSTFLQQAKLKHQLMNPGPELRRDASPVSPSPETPHSVVLHPPILQSVTAVPYSEQCGSPRELVSGRFEQPSAQRNLPADVYRQPLVGRLEFADPYRQQPAAQPTLRTSPPYVPSPSITPPTPPLQLEGILSALQERFGSPEVALQQLGRMWGVSELAPAIPSPAPPEPTHPPPIAVETSSASVQTFTMVASKGCDPIAEVAVLPRQSDTPPEIAPPPPPPPLQASLPHSPPPLSAADAKAVALHPLYCGSQFVKYGKKGKPRLRWLWLTGTPPVLCWSAKPPPTAASKKFSLETLASVDPSANAPNFQRFNAGNGQFRGLGNSVHDGSLCVSINIGSRTVDLKALQPEVWQQWVAGLQAILPPQP